MITLLSSVITVESVKLFTAGALLAIEVYHVAKNYKAPTKTTRKK